MALGWSENLWNLARHELSGMIRMVTSPIMAFNSLPLQSNSFRGFFPAAALIFIDDGSHLFTSPGF